MRRYWVVTRTTTRAVLKIMELVFVLKGFLDYTDFSKNDGRCFKHLPQPDVLRKRIPNINNLNANKTVFYNLHRKLTADDTGGEDIPTVSNSSFVLTASHWLRAM